MVAIIAAASASCWASFIPVGDRLLPFLRVASLCLPGGPGAPESGVWKLGLRTFLWNLFSFRSGCSPVTGPPIYRNCFHSIRRRCVFFFWVPFLGLWGLMVCNK
jgi:hypothetical protein